MELADKLEAGLGLRPSLEETERAIEKLYARAEARPNDADLQHRARLIRDILETHRQRIERLAGAVGLDPGTDFDELKARGLALIIESGGRHRPVQRVFDEIGFRYWQTPEWAAFKATPAGIEYEKSQLAVFR